MVTIGELLHTEGVNRVLWLRDRTKRDLLQEAADLAVYAQAQAMLAEIGRRLPNSPEHERRGLEDLRSCLSRFDERPETPTLNLLVDALKE